MTNRGTKRRRSTVSYRKLAISVPAELFKAVKHELRSRPASSVSAFISEAVEEKLERDRLQEALDEVWQRKPMTEAERRWANKILEV